MTDLRALPPDSMGRFFQRSKASSSLPEEPDLSRLLAQILEKAGELVPSESGALLLDDPLMKGPDPLRNRLHVVSAFGPAAARRVGSAIPATRGVVGHVYTTGAAHLSTDTRADGIVPDAAEGVEARSIIAAPVRIGGAVCGAIELSNRRDGEPYDRHDLLVLEVFASYTASSIQNALDARHAHVLAKVDDLTGLYNDRYIHVRLREELERIAGTDERCSLLFLDLDHFKPVNDTYGHLVGSQVLRELGFLLRRVTGAEDAVVARYGGDEFTIMLPDRSAEEAARVAEALRAAIAEAVFLPRAQGADLPALELRGLVTASIGVAELHGSQVDGSDAATALIRRADEAMYRAKESGKDRVMVAERGRSGDPPLGNPAGSPLGSGA
jgi:diguanylate cyclase (GGDEF)-like protein